MTRQRANSSSAATLRTSTSGGCAIPPARRRPPPRMYKEKDYCEAELRADMAARPGAEVLDATVTGEFG